MSFSNAYYIPKTEKKTYANGREIWQMPDDFKKYQLLRTGALFGLNISANDNKIMMSNGSMAIVIDGRNIPDYVFVSYMQKIREQYNTIRRYALAGTDPEKLQSKKYDIIQPAPGVSPEDAYPEDKDPQIYLEDLFADLQATGKTEKHTILKNNILAQISAVTHLTRTTTWGSKALAADETKCLADSLKKFFENNDYTINRQAAQGLEKE